jgi:hypothetical protein
MAVPSRHEGSLHVTGTLSCNSLKAPDGSITNAMIEGAAAIAASKLIRHQSIDVEAFAEGSVITNLNRILHITRGTSGTLLALEAMQFTAATTSGNSVVVDLQKCTASTTWVTCLTTGLTLNSTDAVRTPRVATINTAGMSDGDIFRLSILTTGSTATQAAGLALTLTYEETYS